VGGVGRNAGDAEKLHQLVEGSHRSNCTVAPAAPPATIQ
jgi:hypothetical protein